MISNAALDDLRACNPASAIAGKWVSLRRGSKTGWLVGPRPVHSTDAFAKDRTSFECDAERWVCAVCADVLSTAMSFLCLYRDPVVAQVTRRCDWRIADLVGDPRLATLYLLVPLSDISRTTPLLRLVPNQIGRRLTEDCTPRSAGIVC